MLAVWITASLLKSPGLLFLSPSVPLPTFWCLYRVRQLQVVSPSLTYSIVFFSSLERYIYWSFFSLSYNFNRWSAGTAKSTIRLFLFFFLLLIITRSGRLTEIRCQNDRDVCVSFSWTDSGLCLSHWVEWSNFSFLHNSLWIIFSTQSYLIFTLIHFICL